MTVKQLFVTVMVMLVATNMVTGETIEEEPDFENLLGNDVASGTASGDSALPKDLEEKCAELPVKDYHNTYQVGTWSEWSSCSRTCCLGVRCRSCLKEPCYGHATELCNTNVCSGNCSEPQDCRRRQEFLSMSDNDKHRFLEAFITVSTHREWKYRFLALARIHFENFRGMTIHHKHEFLPWHRWYLLMLENLLRCYDCGVTVPYWDWSLEAENWERSAVWQWIGGDGNWFDNDYVDSGPFRKDAWTHALLPQTWLRRSFFPLTATTAKDIGNALSKYTAETFVFPGPGQVTSLEEWLRGQVHNIGHFMIGGTMMTLFSSGSPEFYLHHGFIDKIWDDWQKRDDSHKAAYFGSISTLMAATDYSPKDVHDLENQPGGVRVCYIKPTGLKGLVVDLTRSLSAHALQSVPGARAAAPPQQVWELFKIPVEERERVVQSNKENQPSKTAAVRLLKDQQRCRFTKEKTREQTEGCNQQEEMGLSIRALLQAGVDEGKIPDGELKKFEVTETKRPELFQLPLMRHPAGVSDEFEKEQNK